MTENGYYKYILHSYKMFKQLKKNVVCNSGGHNYSLFYFYLNSLMQQTVALSLSVIITIGTSLTSFIPTNQVDILNVWVNL